MSVYTGANSDDVGIALLWLSYNETAWHGDSVFRRDSDGLTSLHEACEFGAPLKVVRILIQQLDKATIEAKDREGNTALHHLVSKTAQPTAEAARLLLAAGGRRLAEQTNSAGITALETAISNNVPKQILELLRGILWLPGPNICKS